MLSERVIFRIFGRSNGALNARHVFLGFGVAGAHLGELLEAPVLTLVVIFAP